MQVWQGWVWLHRDWGNGWNCWKSIWIGRPIKSKVIWTILHCRIWQWCIRLWEGQPSHNTMSSVFFINFLFLLFYCLSMMLVLTIHRHQRFTDNFIIELISGHSSWESYKHLQSSGWEWGRRTDRGRVRVRMSAGQSSGGSSQCRSRDVNYQLYLCFISIIT